MNELIQVLPAIALRGTTILPKMIAHFDVSRERSIAAVTEAMVREQKMFVVTQKDPAVEQPGLSDLYEMGTVVQVKQIVKLQKGLVRVMVEGECRARLIQLFKEEPFLEAELEKVEDENDLYISENAKEAMRQTLMEFFASYCEENRKFSRDLAEQIQGITDFAEAMDQIAINLPLSYDRRQKLLEAVKLSEKYELLGEILANEVHVMQIKEALQNKIKAHIDQNQKEYILREQLKVIREELGEDTTDSDIEKFEAQLKELQASDEVRNKIKKEIGRLKLLGNNPSEGPVVRGYVETLLSLPWEKLSKDNTNIKRAEEILERDHYGLDKVKERILEFLSVRKLTKKGDSPILCLVGPPGTGKTSIARSVATALHKEYIRICLGGVSDEAEIRGHRRTYVGAMPGRIVAGLQKCGVRNPLMLLDEIDKMGSNYKGDPAAAMLEVLDSEQNSHFSDHYVELPLDLSDVLFIATANDASTIPRPLLDRMEIIEVSSYTENEKLHIGEEFLVPKQKKKNGIKDAQLEIEKDALKAMISGYTKEAGVRGLERKIGQICRKAARTVIEDKKAVVMVTADNLAEYLGKPRFTYQEANEKPEIGIVRGLAWTSVGGDTLQIEVNLMPGKGELVLTGKLGDVMKESAQIGISYIRSVAEQYGIDDKFFKEHDIHIHIPEGAVPKDGPSAGITMATAVLSAVTGTPVRADVAMTGEITLRGRVLPIGGLKEKLLAANKAGMKLVLVPAKNRPDVEELDTEITEGMRISYVTEMPEVIAQAFVKE
ncbi:MAG: endopeptidase La [Lachnospiraceae bacterium]